MNGWPIMQESVMTVHAIDARDLDLSPDTSLMTFVKFQMEGQSSRTK